MVYLPYGNAELFMFLVETGYFLVIVLKEIDF